MQNTIQQLNIGTTVTATLQGLNTTTNNITNGLANIPTQFTTTGTGTTTGGGLKLVKPEPFKGGKGPHAHSFIQSCQLYFNLQPNDFPTDNLKIQFVLMFLHNKAVLWAQPIKNETINPGVMATGRLTIWNTFFDEFKATFYGQTRREALCEHSPA